MVLRCSMMCLRVERESDIDDWRSGPVAGDVEDELRCCIYFCWPCFLYHCVALLVGQFKSSELVSTHLEVFI